MSEEIGRLSGLIGEVERRALDHKAKERPRSLPACLQKKF